MRARVEGTSRLLDKTSIWLCAVFDLVCTRRDETLTFFMRHHHCKLVVEIVLVESFLEMPPPNGRKRFLLVHF